MKKIRKIKNSRRTLKFLRQQMFKVIILNWYRVRFKKKSKPSRDLTNLFRITYK